MADAINYAFPHGGGQGAWIWAETIAGVRSTDAAWEASIFAKNAFNTDETLSRDANAYTISGSPFPVSTTGYFGATSTPRREIGVNVRYAFSSR